MAATLVKTALLFLHSTALGEGLRGKAGPRRIDDVQELGQGLTLTILQAGDGVTFPEVGDTLAMHYTGFLGGSSGTQFDSSRDRGKPFAFIVGKGEVIQGWDLGVPKMSLGERAMLHIPAQLGYGKRGVGGVIPPNADLEFDVQLLKIGDKAASISSPTKDEANMTSGANSDDFIGNLPDADKPAGLSMTYVLGVSLAICGCCVGSFHVFRMFTGPGKTPPPLLNEAELAEEDSSSWMSNQQQQSGGQWMSQQNAGFTSLG